MLLSHSGDKTWEYSIFSMSVLHNLQVHFTARLCQKKTKVAYNIRYTQLLSNLWLLTGFVVCESALFVLFLR